MKYQYSTKPEGMNFYCTAKCTNEGANITITQDIKASSHREASEQFEGYLGEHHEGFDFIVSILSESDKNPKDKLIYAS